MQSLQALHWTHPSWLLLALLPLCFALLTRQKRQRLLAYAEPHLRPWAIKENRPGHGGYRLMLQVMIWALLGAALADPYLPRWQYDSQLNPGLREDVSLMVVLDVSASMSLDDVAPGRNQRARIELVDLLQRIHGERIGLVVFAGQAGLVMPLSHDPQAFLYYMQSAPSLLPTVGSGGLNSALSLAAEELRQSSSHSSAVLLITSANRASLNSDSQGLLKTIDSFASEQLPLYVMAVSDADSLDIDHDTLSHLAEKTAGRFSLVANGDDDWRTLYDEGIYHLDSTMMQNLSQQQKQPCFSWFLLPALLLLMFSRIPAGIFQSARLQVLFSVLLISIIAWPVYADENSAHDSYRRQHYLAAQIDYAQLNGYTARFGEGASAYRREDWKQAINSFTQAALLAINDIQRADALYNLGNTFYRDKKYKQAIEAYQSVLLYQSDHSRTLHNLQLARSKTQALSAGSSLTAAEEYGRYDETVEKEMQDESIDTSSLPSHQDEHADDEVASGKVTVQTEAVANKSTRALVFLPGELSASRKKLELVDDQHVQLLGELLAREGEGSR